MFEISKDGELFIEQLIKKMTLEEKIGQMNQISVSRVGGFGVDEESLVKMLSEGKITQNQLKKHQDCAMKDYHEDDIRKGWVGSYMIQDPVEINRLQKIAMEESRLAIPLIIGRDVIHGFYSVYPIALAEAGSFEPELYEATAHMAARESRTQGISWHFAPMLDVCRDARWGRIAEGPGEDPYLASVFAQAKIRGLQNDKTSSESYVAACLKHFVAYGACESGRDYNTASMAISLLCNIYLPPFKAAIEEGAATVMSSFNDLNGMPCTVNSMTLREILKEWYQFNGFVVSDANAIIECVNHGIVQDKEYASIMAAKAGLDMDMGSRSFISCLKNAVNKGNLKECVIDDAVRRILRVKYWLGLFEKPYVSESSIHKYDVLPQSHKLLARQAAEKSIVLLKNEGNILPLSKDKKISLVGELANSRSAIIGSWAMNWRDEDCVTIYEGLKNVTEDVEWFECGGLNKPLNTQEVMDAVDYGDIIIAVVGEYDWMSGEAASRMDIHLPGKQRELLKKLQDSGKTVIILLINGRPLALDWESEHFPAIVEGWQLGIEMGNAVANVLFGDVIPSAKLSVSFPYDAGQCPIYYNHPATGRPGSSFKFTSRYIDGPFEPLYPFGYGLSYTTFSYTNFKVYEEKDKIIASVDVYNNENIGAIEIVQFYIQDVYASIVRPVKELKGFKKVYIEAHQLVNVQIVLLKKNMGFYDNKMNYCLENGLFKFFIGTNSKECLEFQKVINFDGSEKLDDECR